MQEQFVCKIVRFFNIDVIRGEQQSIIIDDDSSDVLKTHPKYMER